jgi:hypothetical protein
LPIDITTLAGQMETMATDETHETKTENIFLKVKPPLDR